MTTETILELLDGVRETSRGAMAICPSHDDHHPSLSVCTGRAGQTLVHCFAGCSVQDICEALGIQVRDLYPAQSANLRASRKIQLRRERERCERRRQSAYQGVRVDLLRESEALILAARNISIDAWTAERLNNELNQLSDAYRALEEENQ